MGSKNFCGFRDQNSHRFWVKIWDQLQKDIPRYDPVISMAGPTKIWTWFLGRQ